jgi:hypothetical protein
MQDSQSSSIGLSVLAVALCLAPPACSSAQEERKFDPPFKLPDNVELRRGLVYGRGGSQDLQLDLFLLFVPALLRLEKFLDENLRNG